MECLFPQERRLDHEICGSPLAFWNSTGYLINASLHSQDATKMITPKMSLLYIYSWLQHPLDSAWKRASEALGGRADVTERLLSHVAMLIFETYSLRGRVCTLDSLQSHEFALPPLVLPDTTHNFLNTYTCPSVSTPTSGRRVRNLHREFSNGALLYVNVDNIDKNMFSCLRSQVPPATS